MEQKIEEPNQAELNWIDENLCKIREILGISAEQSIELKDLDDAFGKWLDSHNPENEDPNPFINAFGIAFGQYLIDHIGLKWAVVTDDHGTEIAVHGQPGDALVFPPNFISKRYVGKQKNFFCLIYPEMKKDIETIMQYNREKPWWKFWQVNSERNFMKKIKIPVKNLNKSE
ncbi:MAG: DUF3806 domain-containing protein [Candidatus Omnitrophota bacterium]|jgi:hypothetical protein